jgi:hypothetical protein
MNKQIAFGALLLTLFCAVPTAAQTPPAPAAPPPPACASPEHRGFDFWVGEWDVFPNGAGPQVARSQVERMFGNCAIRETWMPLNGGGGGSFSLFERSSGRWHQTWVDSTGSRIEFEGGMAAGAMVLTGWWPHVNGPGQHALIRMTYTPQSGGSVRQFGQASVDQGQSWTPSFDFIYRRRATPEG